MLCIILTHSKIRTFIQVRYIISPESYSVWQSHNLQRSTQSHAIIHFCFSIRFLFIATVSLPLFRLSVFGCLSPPFAVSYGMSAMSIIIIRITLHINCYSTDSTRIFNSSTIMFGTLLILHHIRNFVNPVHTVYVSKPMESRLLASAQWPIVISHIHSIHIVMDLIICSIHILYIL